MVEDVSGMLSSMHSMMRRLAAGVGAFLLVLLLMACGGGRSLSSSDATATAHALTPTPGVTFTTYNGPGFTLKYPQGWTATPSKIDVDFTDTSGNTLTVGFTPNPNSASSSDQLADAGLAGAKANFKNAQTITVPSTMILAGQSWSQRAASGTSIVNGQNGDVEAVVLATDYPKFGTDTKGYTLIYVAPKKTFAQSQSRYFMPMLQAFAFTS